MIIIAIIIVDFTLLNAATAIKFVNNLIFISSPLIFKHNN